MVVDEEILFIGGRRDWTPTDVKNSEPATAKNYFLSKEGKHWMEKINHHSNANYFHVPDQITDKLLNSTDYGCEIHRTFKTAKETIKTTWNIWKMQHCVF